MAIVGNVVRRWEFDSSASILFIGENNIHSPFRTTLNMCVWMIGNGVVPKDYQPF
jgi:hypothetical protein